MYADDNQLKTDIDTNSPDDLSQLTAGAGTVTHLLIRNNLLLNPNNSEAIIIGTRHQLAKLDQSVG